MKSLLVALPAFVQSECLIPNYDSNVLRIDCIANTCSAFCNNLYADVLIDCDEHGQLTAPLPHCEKQNCPPISSSDNRIDNCNDNSCLFSCKNHQLIGPESIYCEGGNWSNDPPICGSNRSCPELFILNGYVKCSSKQYRRSVCQFNCPEGYILNGDTSRSCIFAERELKWDGEIPTCDQIPDTTDRTITVDPTENPRLDDTNPPEDPPQSIWDLIKENMVAIGIGAAIFFVVIIIAMIGACRVRRKKNGKKDSGVELYDTNPTLQQRELHYNAGHRDEIVTRGANRDHAFSDPSQTFYAPNFSRAQYPMRGPGTGNVSPYSQVNVRSNPEEDPLISEQPSIYDPSNADQSHYPSTRGPSQNQNYYSHQPNSELGTFIY